MAEPTLLHLTGWLKDQFELVNQKLDQLASNDEDQFRMLKKIKSGQEEANAKLDQILKYVAPAISPELESIINQVSKQAASIDQKVPDAPPVPPTP